MLCNSLIPLDCVFKFIFLAISPVISCLSLSTGFWLHVLTQHLHENCQFIVTYFHWPIPILMLLTWFHLPLVWNWLTFFLHLVNHNIFEWFQNYYENCITSIPLSHPASNFEVFVCIASSIWNRFCNEIVLNVGHW